MWSDTFFCIEVESRFKIIGSLSILDYFFPKLYEVIKPLTILYAFYNTGYSISLSKFYLSNSEIVSKKLIV